MPNCCPQCKMPVGSIHTFECTYLDNQREQWEEQRQERINHPTQEDDDEVERSCERDLYC